MNKEPQHIIKFSSQTDDGEYLQMVFDAEAMNHEEITEKFYDFLRGLGYALDRVQIRTL